MMEAWKKQEADFYDITAGYYQRGMKQGITQGIQQGIQQGITQGIKQGIQQGIKQSEAQWRQKEKGEMIATLAETMTPESIATALKMPLATVITILNQNKREE